MKKKYFVWLIVLALLLTGCHIAADPGSTDDPAGNTDAPTASPTNPDPTEPSDPTEPATPTEPKNSFPEGIPADLNTDASALDQFQQLLTITNATGTAFIFRQALTHSYDSVQAVQLWQIFYNGILGENNTDIPDEIYELYGFERDWDCYSITTEQVNTALREVFGVTLSDLPDDAFGQYIHYYEKTDSYYIGNNDSNAPVNVHIFGIRDAENGGTEVYYGYNYGTKEDYRVYGYVTLVPAGYTWHVTANHIIRDNG